MSSHQCIRFDVPTSTGKKLRLGQTVEVRLRGKISSLSVAPYEGGGVSCVEVDASSLRISSGENEFSAMAEDE